MVSAQPALLPSAVPAVSAPTRLRLPDLLQATDRYADGVLSGLYDHLLPDGGTPTDDRWFARLGGDDEFDVWLISWVPDRSTELHDHGGSLGALTVVSGALRETRWGRPGIAASTPEGRRPGRVPVGMGARRRVDA
ncbi:MAG: hypothetical protein NVSMB60_19480 [Mycobacterium sp.]